ncbi:MAG: hypothetical protein MJ252_05495 [archaeon]|nr:hypothetical protein [archaeon]
MEDKKKISEDLPIDLLQRNIIVTEKEVKTHPSLELEVKIKNRKNK